MMLKRAAELPIGPLVEFNRHSTVLWLNKNVGATVSENIFESMEDSTTRTTFVAISWPHELLVPVCVRWHGCRSEEE